MPLDIPGFAYAVLIAHSGVMCYVKHHSIPAFRFGLLWGIIIGYGAYRTSQNPHNYGVILGSSAVLGGIMGYRLYKTGKIGLLDIASYMMVIRYTLRALGIEVRVSYNPSLGRKDE